MVRGCSIGEEASFKGKEKGYAESFIDKNSGVLMCWWHDNAPVTVASNLEPIVPLDTARRFDTSKTNYVNIPRPKLIANFNKHMGGTDQIDQKISTCRPRIRN